MRGALRTSRTRGGMRWTWKARETHAPDAYGEVAWFGRRGAGAKLAIGSAGDGGKRAVLREEREVSRKATAQGRPGCSACTCMLVCAFAMCTGTRDRGCSKHPVFPAPSIQEEGNEVANLGRNAPRDRGGVDDGCHYLARSPDEAQRNPGPLQHRPGLRGACHRARIRATRWLHPGYARSHCRMSDHLFIVAPIPRRFSLFWRQVWQPAHTLGLKRVVARERAALFTDLPQMRVEHSWGH